MVLLVCPAEAGHAAVLDWGSTIAYMLDAVHGNPDVGIARCVLLEWRDLDGNLVRNAEVESETLTELWRINEVPHIVGLAVIIHLDIVLELPDGTERASRLQTILVR